MYNKLKLDLRLAGEGGGGGLCSSFAVNIEFKHQLIVFIKGTQYIIVAPCRYLL